MIFVYGGAGALGKDIVSIFNKNKFSTINVDFVENKEATHNILIKTNSFDEIAKQVEKELSEILKDQKLDHVFCVAGGWVGGSISSGKLVENCEKMWKSSVETSIITSQMASKHMKSGGLLILPGAQGALNPTPKMIAYGLAKTAVHHLVKSLGTGEGLPENTTVLGIAPLILDTPMNRKFMTKDDTSNWTKTDELALKILEWTQGLSLPKSGSIVKITTKQGENFYDLE